MYLIFMLYINRRSASLLSATFPDIAQVHYFVIISLLYRVPKKTSTQTFVHISANYIPIFKISAPLESAVHLQ